MNIFVLSKDPIKAARMQCDKHIVKMVTESAQMLSTAHRLLDGQTDRGLLPDLDNHIYKIAHPKHPCTIWTMECALNYEWHYKHFQELAREYEYRYGKKHGAWLKTGRYLANPPHSIRRTLKKTPFKLAMKSNPECVVENDVVESYRNFYKSKRDRFKMVWTNRPTPDWFL